MLSTFGKLMWDLRLGSRQWLRKGLLGEEDVPLGS